MLTITIETDDAAFEHDAGAEVGRILQGIAVQAQAHGLDSLEDRPILDLNGNTVGMVSLDGCGPGQSSIPGQ